MNNNFFIWTESIYSFDSCRESINSFLKFHKNLYLNVFALEEHIKFLPVSEKITYHTFAKINLLDHLRKRLFYGNKKIFSLDRRFFKRNNVNDFFGKSLLWGYILKKYINYPLIIHFSNKIIFSDSHLSHLIKMSYEYDLISTKILQNKKRKYIKNLNCSYSFDHNLILLKPFLIPSISRINQYAFAKLIRGQNKSNERLKIGFLDQLCRELISNNGKFTEINQKTFDSSVSFPK